ncbi:ABC transporter substrate-binding protein [Methanobrevibacter sp.]|uniref:ABC transporter substrate-binding protein n=1 Tax=Methanobrevibacter sp. TaxID=66852 RepID=UPI003870C9DF
MDKKYIIAIAIIALIAIIGIAAMMGSSNTVRADDELVVATTSHNGEPETGMDPIYGWNYYSSPLVQSTLLKMNRDMEFEDDLATDVEASDDFKTYTVKLRDDVNFTDGTPLTAEDVAFTYNEAKKSGASLDFSMMDNATAKDDYTVVFNLNQPDSTFKCKFPYLGIVPSDSYNNETYGSNPIGSGPWKFAQWDKGQQIILEKNPDYYGKQPEFNKLTLVFLENEAAVTAVMNHEVDVAAVPLEYTNATADGYTMYTMDSLDVRGISFPMVNNTGALSAENLTLGNNITADKAIREALNYGISRETICDGALNGAAVPNYDAMSNAAPWANPEGAIKDGDIEKAKQILKEGGWEDTDGDGIVEKDGQKASLNLYYASNAPERQAIAVSVAEQAKDIGIEMNATGSNWDEMDQLKSSECIVYGMGEPDPSTLKLEYYSDLAGIGYANPASLNNSVVDRYIDQAMSQDMDDSYGTWSKISWDGNTGVSPKGDAPWLWVAQLKYAYFVDDTLDISNETENIQPHAGDVLSNVEDWHRVSSIEQK